MRRWGSVIAGPLGVFVAALLLPGGFLLLAWLLYRRYCPADVARRPLT
jgi:hypothetical protein